MIQLIQALHAGNALKLFLDPPDDASYWRVLRKTTDDIAGADDAAALKVYEGSDAPVLDIDGLDNGTTYYYQVFYRIGDAWQASNVQSGVPATDYTDHNVDVLVLLRERLRAGLAVEVARGVLKPRRQDNSPRDCIDVLNAPPVFEETPWPVVTVHLIKDAPSEFFLGQTVAPDEAIDGGIEEYDGYFDRWHLKVMGWSLNPDERIRLRQAMKRIVLANTDVFAAEGLTEMQFDLEDAEAISGEYPAPVYQVAGTFTCLAPAFIGATDDAITAVDVTATGVSDE
ncbi:MAG TPA: hypothetical protein VFM97_00090 [Gammaproteobacteria bacterium]|nr:hypothetical protein [Gammaproteobacteria bacterium]